MNIKILSDSTCDLSPEQLAQHNVDLAHLTIVKDGEAFVDGITITPADIFAHVAAGGDLCSTTAYNVEEYQNLFAKYADQYDGVIHITFIGSYRIKLFYRLWLITLNCYNHLFYAKLFLE